jgi:hypothetical protein
LTRAPKGVPFEEFTLMGRPPHTYIVMENIICITLYFRNFVFKVIKVISFGKFHLNNSFYIYFFI